MRSLITFFAAMLISAPAFAVTISNCDAEDRKLTINNGGEVREQIIPVGSSIHTYGPMVSIKTDGDFIRVREYDIYCIRKGKVSLQMRRKFQNKRH